MHYTDPAFPFLVAAIALSGLVRGFAGFGAAMVFMPLAAAIIGPKTAVIIMWLVDTLPTLPILLPAFVKVRWRTVLSVLAGYAPAVPFGVLWLARGNVTGLRWAISAAILAAVAVLWSGWRYPGGQSRPLSAVAGALSGVIGGATQLAGPPVLVYWLSGEVTAGQFRANAIVFFFMTTILSGLAMATAGLFTADAAWSALSLAPVYAVAVLAGQRLFPLASESFFRTMAFALITFAALSSLPLFDALLGR